MSECVGEGCAHESNGHGPRVLVVDDNTTEEMQVALAASADTAPAPCCDGHSLCDACQAKKDRIGARGERMYTPGRRHHIHGAGRMRMVSPCTNDRRKARRRHEKAQRRKNSR